MPNKDKNIHNQQAREYYHRNKEKICEQKRNVSKEQKLRNAESNRKSRANHSERINKYDLTPTRRMSNAKSVAKKRGYDWNLTLEQYTEIIKHPCYYCDGFFGRTLKGSGCDRINNDLGYSVDNVLSCCGFCNRLRSNVMTVDECKALIILLISMRKNNVSHLQDNK